MAIGTSRPLSALLKGLAGSERMVPRHADREVLLMAGMIIEDPDRLVTYGRSEPMIAVLGGAEADPVLSMLSDVDCSLDDILRLFHGVKDLLSEALGELKEGSPA